MKQIIINNPKKSVSLEFNEHFKNLALVAQELTFSSFEHYKQVGLTYVDVPEIVGITGACENVDTLFRVESKVKVPLFFSQTGQLSLEQALQVFSGAFTVIHSGRDEEQEDTRHLRQFRLTEEEFDCTLAGMTRETYDEDTMFEHLLLHIETSIKAILMGVVEKHGDMLSSVYGRDTNEIKNAIKFPFNRIEYATAVSLLNKNGFPKLKFGDDLTAKHEAKVVELKAVNGILLPTFITKYPQEIKFFNMKQSSSNPKVVLSADLVLPYSGESVGSAGREEDYKRLKNRLLTSTMFRLHKQRGGTYEDFSWYMNIMENELTNPHAGYGIGNDRVLQYIFGESDIRKVSLFGLLNMQTKDWEPKKQTKKDLSLVPAKKLAN